MRRIILTLLLALSALPAFGAGVFDGTTSDLVVTQSATAIDYPVVMSCWYRATDADHRGTLIALSDDGAGGLLDCLALEIRGDVANNWIHAVSTADDASSLAETSVDSIVAGEWRYAAAIFESASSRRIRDTDATVSWQKAWREETTSRAVGNWTHLSVGGLYNGGVSNRFDGSISNARVYFGGDAAALIADPYGGRPILGMRPSLFLEQTLLRKANDFCDWGPTVTNNGVTFDFENPKNTIFRTYHGEAQYQRQPF